MAIERRRTFWQVFWLFKPFFLMRLYANDKRNVLMKICEMTLQPCEICRRNLSLGGQKHAFCLVWSKANHQMIDKRLDFVFQSQMWLPSSRAELTWDSDTTPLYTLGDLIAYNKKYYDLEFQGGTCCRGDPAYANFYQQSWESAQATGDKRDAAYVSAKMVRH